MDITKLSKGAKELMQRLGLTPLELLKVLVAGIEAGAQELLNAKSAESRGGSRITRGEREDIAKAVASGIRRELLAVAGDEKIHFKTVAKFEKRAAKAAE